jgi:hypothetical protein
MDAASRSDVAPWPRSRKRPAEGTGTQTHPDRLQSEDTDGGSCSNAAEAAAGGTLPARDSTDWS